MAEPSGAAAPGAAAPFAFPAFGLGLELWELIFRSVPWRARAALRGVCRAWRDALDARGARMWHDVPRALPRWRGVPFHADGAPAHPGGRWSTTEDRIAHCCRRGRPDAARWLAARWGLGAADLRAVACAGADGRWPQFCTGALFGACARGDLAVAQWLAAAAGLAPADAEAAAYPMLLTAACEGGHLAVAQWATEAFGLGPADARRLRNTALRAACAGGHLAMAVWLTRRFGLTDVDVYDSFALYVACEQGRRRVVQWLVQRFQYGLPETLGPANRDALYRAATQGHYGVIRWLAVRFGLCPGDFEREGWVPAGGLSGPPGRGGTRPRMTRAVRIVLTPAPVVAPA